MTPASGLADNHGINAERAYSGFYFDGFRPLAPPMRAFDIDDRVILQGHWGFPDGTVGTIAEPPEFVISLAEPGEWHEHRRIQPCRKGMMTSYYVAFDTPTDDGSGDGPYFAAEVDELSIRRLHP